MSARDYAVLYVGGKVTRGGSVGGVVLGGDAVLDAEQHALDGTEHSAASDLTRLNASTTAHGLLPKLSGDVGDALRGDGTWVAVADSTLLLPDATITVTKDPGNPTFNFASLPEGTIIKVGSTYYCPYTAAGTGDVKLATATDRNGPWAAGTTIFTEATVTWDVSGFLYSPEIVEVGGTYYLFYAMVVTGGTTSSTNAIGVATATTITGPYTDSGAAVLSPGAASSPTSRRVGEPSPLYQGGVWNMAFMGEDSDIAYQESEKVFTATAPAATGPWTVTNSGNAVIGFGTGGSGYDLLVADPYLFYANGYFWIMFAGSDTSTPTVSASQFLAYSTTIEGPWTVLPDPILEPGASGAWDDEHVFRGSIYYENGTYSGVYCGYAGAGVYKGGNFTMSIVSSGEIDLRADDIPIDDAGGYFTGTEVEAALQEAGAAIVALEAGGGGHWEVIIDGTAPPVAVTTEDETDWVYGWVPD